MNCWRVFAGDRNSQFSLRAAERKGPEELRFGPFGEICCGSQHHEDILRWLLSDVQFMLPLAAARAPQPMSRYPLERDSVFTQISAAWTNEYKCI